jgi:hypothetical protein
LDSKKKKKKKKNRKETALHYAVRSNDINTVKILLAYGADVEAVADSGTPTDIANDDKIKEFLRPLTPPPRPLTSATSPIPSAYSSEQRRRYHQDNAEPNDEDGPPRGTPQNGEKGQGSDERPLPPSPRDCNEDEVGGLT